jgi:hypothetical protein
MHRVLELPDAAMRIESFLPKKTACHQLPPKASR